MSRRERRQLLATAVRERLVPVLEGIGFDSTRKHVSRRSDTPERGHFFARNRGSFLDEIWIHWDKFGKPRFIIEFKTTQTERMVPIGRNEPIPWLEYGRIYPKSASLLRKLIRAEPAWFGATRDVNEVIEAAARRLAELNDYLKSGKRAPHIWVGEGIRFERPSAT